MPHYLATNRGHINIAGNTIGLRKRHRLHVESEFGSTWRFKSFVDVKFILLERAPANRRDDCYKAGIYYSAPDIFLSLLGIHVLDLSSYY